MRWEDVTPAPFPAAETEEAFDRRQENEWMERVAGKDSVAVEDLRGMSVNFQAVSTRIKSPEVSPKGTEFTASEMEFAEDS